MDRKPRLLFLCHRIPYPPNKGDKIRSYHLLRHLAGDYRVHLGAFVDDPTDWEHADHLRSLCEECLFLPLHPLLGRLRSLTGLLRGEALTLPYYRSADMEQWVRQTCRDHRVERIVVYSSAMAQYVLGDAFGGIRRVIDFVDVDSDKWCQYADSKPAHSAWIYRREARRLLGYDLSVARAFDVSVFVSRDEAALFRRLAGDAPPRVDHMVNGVDTDYFSPEIDLPCPYPSGRPVVVFTGAMDYWANVDAVGWFCRNVLPSLTARYPQLQFYIVGTHPSDEVKRLAGDRVVVTGAVPDVRPYLRHASVVVAPMRIARGIQNKVLEGLSMARPVVTTAKGLEGIDAVPGEHLLVADEADAFAGRVSDILVGDGADLGSAGREFVCRANSWAASLARFSGFLEDDQREH
jgi:sugar transferase (PEP-CTERM/EpsH1 system associated)